MRKTLQLCLLLAAFPPFSLALKSGTAEEDEAARIQIAGGSARSVEQVAIFPSSPESVRAAHAWLGCKLELKSEKGLQLLSVAASAEKPWSGFAMQASKDAKPIRLETARDFEETFLNLKLKLSSSTAEGKLQALVSGKSHDGKDARTGYLQLAKIKPDGAGFCELSIRLKDFEGAGKLASVDGLGFQFMEGAERSSFLLASASISRRVSKTAKTVFDIETPDLSGLELSKEAFPESASNIRIAGPNIVRNGKPVFLTGVEDDAVDFPWLYRLLGFDVIQIQDFSPETVMNVKIEGDSARVSWNENREWIETKVRLLLANGLGVHVNYWDGVPNSKDFKERFADALAETSHFYGFRLDNPLGRKIKEGYQKATLRTLGKYPITFYELYNEIYYGDASPKAVEAFQKEMKEKFGDIETLDKALGCSFKSFELIAPPRKKANWMVTKNEISPQDVSPELYSEWQKFIEKWLGKELRALTANFKKDLKTPNSYVIYQATMGLHEDFSGFTGTYPSELLSAEDALCQEGGMHFYAQPRGEESQEAISKMTRSLMVWDLLKGLSPDKPVYLSECGVGSYAIPFETKHALLNLKGAWRFADDSEGKGESLGYQKESFDDSAWKSVEMPGVWGSQGFAKCTLGWLRKSFDAPQGYEKGLFLTGKELADYAGVYLNGCLVYETSVWSEAFSVDVSKLIKPKGNVLALRIANSYEVGGQVQGGIRDFLVLTGRQFFKAPKLSAGQMRSWLWAMAAHDVSGVQMSYFYPAATNKDLPPIYAPTTRDFDATKAIPEAKREIDSVSEILLPRPRIKGDVAFIYPFETGRARIPENTRDMFAGKITLSIMEYYLAALFSQVATEATSAKALCEGGCDKFKAIVLTASPRVPSALPDALERFVFNGGVLILDNGSMSFDDDWHKPIPAPSWLGASPAIALDGPRRVGSGTLGLKNVETEARAFDGNYGSSLSCAGAEAIASFDDGSAAISSAKHGKGHVYYFGCKLPFLQLKGAIAAILAKHGVAPQTTIEAVDGGRADFVESHVIGSNGRYVWVLNNFGGGDIKLKAAWPGAPDGSYSLADIRTGKTLEASVTAKALREGIALTAPSQDPRTLLLESNALPSKTALSPLPPSRKRMLDAWRLSPPGDVKVLFNACARDEIDPFKMLTGKRMLEDRGFEISYATELPKEGLVKSFPAEGAPKPLSEFAIYVLPGTRFLKDENIQSITDYVKGGGSVLLSATANFGYFNWLSNLSNRKKLFDAFGLRCADTNFKDEKASSFSPYFAELSNVKQGHPVTAGVERVQIAGGAEIQCAGTGQEALVKSNATSVPKEAPFLVAMEFGKGRVVAMGDAQWLEPEWLDKADNAQLMLNVFNWLARRETKALDKEALRKESDSKF